MTKNALNFVLVILILFSVAIIIGATLFPPLLDFFFPPVYGADDMLTARLKASQDVGTQFRGKAYELEEKLKEGGCKKITLTAFRDTDGEVKVFALCLKR